MEESPLLHGRGLFLFQEVYVKLIYLSQKFYAEYGGCKEILKKPTRPYACLAVYISGVTFAIPFRHHIAHKYAFITKPGCGLDYTKAVVVPDGSYIAPDRVQIDQDEFNALKGQDSRIAREFARYLKLYIKAVQNHGNPHYANITRYSTLQYFENQIM